MTPPEIAVLTNPAAGQGRVRPIRDAAIRHLQSSGSSVTSWIGRDRDDAFALAAKCADRDVDALVVVGGDGLVNLAAEALAGTGVPLGLIPAGTGNDAARTLGVPLGDPVAAAQIVLEGHTADIDLGQVGDRRFVTVLAAGFDARVNRRANAMSWPRGRLRYTWATFAELGSCAPIPYDIIIDGTRHQFEAMIVAVGNGPTYGGGMRIAEGAVLDDGELELVAILPMGRAELLRTFSRIFTADHVRHPSYRQFRGRRITINGPSITAYADGEELAELPLTIQVDEQALRVLVPPTPDKVALPAVNCYESQG